MSALDQGGTPTFRTQSSATCRCQMTMGSYGNYFACGKPAKASYQEHFGDKLGRTRYVCGVHARALDKRKPGTTTPLP